MRESPEELENAVVSFHAVGSGEEAIEEVVRSFPELGDEHEVVVGKKGDVDTILLKVEILPGKEGERESILFRLKDQLRVKTHLGYQIAVHPYGSLFRYEVKAKRFKDLGKKGG